MGTGRSWISQARHGGFTLRDTFGLLFATILAIMAFAVSSSPGNVQSAFATDLYLESFTIDSIDDQIAGEGFAITIRAVDGSGVYVTYDGAGAVLTSTLDAAPDGTASTASAISWTDGVGTATITATNAGAVESITITDGSVTATSNAFAVDPGALAEFVWASIAAPQTAGVSFAISATARDEFENVKTDYTGSGAVLTTTLANAPDGTSPTVPANLTWGAGTGVGSATVTAVKAQPLADQTFTITDGSVTATSNAFAVDPGALAAFDLEGIATQTAGSAFDIGVTAYDQYENVKTDQVGGTLNGLASSPGCAGCAPAVASVAPTHGVVTWSAGIGAASVTAVKAQSGASLTVTDGSVSGSTSFDVNHSATLGGVTLDTIASQVAGVSFPVTVRAFDDYGNVKLDETSGSLSGLASSPGCAACAPAVPIATPTHGTLSGAGGVLSASVTAVKAQTGASITATVGTSTNSASFDVTNSATLAGFTIDTVIGTQTAGAAFNVTVRAYDPYGNINKDNLVGALSNLATSPGCPTPTCTPALVPAAATYGSGSWVAGTKTFTGVIAYNAQAGATIKVDAGPIGNTSNTSNAFTVRGAAATRLFFAYPPFTFDGSPIDTKLSQPIYHTCVPTAPGPANPCGAGSAPVTVLAIDAYGNRAGLTSISVKVTPASAPVTVATNTTTPGVAPYGEAAFGNSLLATATAQTLTLVATAPGATSASSVIQAVNDLEACDGKLCDNNTSNAQARLQKAFGKIKTTTDFYDNGVTTNVRLTTQFVNGADTNQCENRTIGQATDVRVNGLGVGATAPDTTMVMVMPKDTLKAFGITSRGTSSFNVCLGALNISGVADPITPWQQKNMKKGSLLKSAVYGAEGRYWGVPANCGTAGLSPSDPCIGLRSKQAAAVQAYLGMSNAEFALLGIKDADLVIIIEKKSPWDGKGGIY